MKISNKKVALVTGSATGVGAATCKILSQNGWNVVINYSRSETEAKTTAKECEDLGAEVLICKADVANDSECRSMVSQTVEKWGRIDALVNNAGRTAFCSFSDLEGLSKEDFLNLYEVNVVGAYQMARAAYPYLKTSGHGAVVNTSSISAITGVGSSMAYAASKGALSTLTKSLAIAFGPEIRVNGICPGFIQGRWTKNFLGENYENTRAQIEQASVLEKTATPHDVAQAIVFFIEGNQLVTGQLMVLDGGATMQKSVLKKK